MYTSIVLYIVRVICVYIQVYRFMYRYRQIY